MKRLSLLLVALAAVAVAAALPLVFTGTLAPAEAPAAATEAPGLPAAVSAPGDCDDPLAVPGLDGTEVACSIDQCQTNLDCFFRCGGQPGQCVMANPCCKECVCQASSFTVTGG